MQKIFGDTINTVSINISNEIYTITNNDSIAGLRFFYIGNLFIQI